MTRCIHDPPRQAPPSRARDGRGVRRRAAEGAVEGALGQAAGGARRHAALYSARPCWREAGSRAAIGRGRRGTWHGQLHFAGPAMRAQAEGATSACTAAARVAAPPPPPAAATSCCSAAATAAAATASGLGGACCVASPARPLTRSRSIESPSTVLSSPPPSPASRRAMSAEGGGKGMRVGRGARGGAAGSRRYTQATRRQAALPKQSKAG